MYRFSIKATTEGRAVECALQFVAQTWIGREAIALSFAGRPSPVKAIAGGFLSGVNRSFQLAIDGRETSLQTGSRRYKAAYSQTGSILHAVLIAASGNYIIAPDGDVKRAFSDWLFQTYGIPPEIDIYDSNLFELSDVDIDVDPECEWKSLRVCEVFATRRVPSRSMAEKDILQCLSEMLKSGEIPIPSSAVKAEFRPDMDLREYLKTNVRIFAEQVASVKPLCDGAKLDPAVAEMERIPYPAQGRAAQAIVEILKNDRLALCGADMGTGKSIVSLAVANIMSRKKKNLRVLLSAPGITIPKWAEKEIKETLPGASVRIVSSTDDAARYLRDVREGVLPEGLNFLLVGTDRAKLGPDPWCAALWKRIAGRKESAWHCPDCGKWIPGSQTEEGEEIPAGWTLFAAEPLREGMFSLSGIAQRKIKWQLPPKLRKCPRCSASLWRPALKSRGETPNKPRWYACDILRRCKKHFDLYIADEVHEAKAQDSGRGWAFGQMVLASKKVLALTGTLVNGMSTSIKEILWRCDPGSLLAMGFNHKTGMVQWAGRYGTLERTVRVSENDSGIVTVQKKVQQQPKEKPGISPALVADHLLHRSVFMELADLDLPLVDTREAPVFVELDPEHADAYSAFHGTLHDVCSKAFAAGTEGAFARFIPATINAVDRPDLDSIVKVGEEIVVFRGFGSDYLSAKERELIRIVKENLSENRGCFIYAFYTDKYGVQQRLQNILRDAGIEAEILGDIPPEARFEWLHRAEKRGAKVIITNLRRVGVGLDLLPWPTLIFYQISYDINTVRQAAARAWRIGQNRECRIYYLIANGTQQMAQFEVCAVKRAHALLAEGKVDRSEIASYGKVNSFVKDLAECFAPGDLASKWKTLAAKELGVATVSEEDFPKAVAEAQKRLANETLRLCGVLPKDEEEEIEVTDRPTWDELASLLPKRTHRRKKKGLPPGTEQLTLFDLLAAS